MKSLLNRIIKGLYYRTVRPFHWIGFYQKRLIKFILPNLKKITKKKVTFDQYPICNQTTRITGEGKVTIGVKCMFGYKLGGNFYRGIIEIQPRYKQSRIVIGDNITTNNNLILCAANLIVIGNDTFIGQGVLIMDHEAHGIDPGKRKQLGEIGRVIIGKNVWIGNNVTILKNSEIGENTIVAAGAVVSGHFPANVIIGGIPAKIIRNL
jgi:carbonic anhydrase/acetyltransferase-like protein (isoleucine patch superfamily)